MSGVGGDSEDLFSEIAAIRHRSHEGRGEIESLVRLVGHSHRAMADAAREALAALAPMAALPERWTPVPHDGPHSSEEIPAWLVESCADWGTDGRLVQVCVAELARSSGEARARLLAQLAELPGLSRVLEAALRARQPALAEAQQEMLARVHDRRFPLQINLAPTLACQLTCAYCVSAGVEARGDTTRSWSDLLAILDWARARGVRRVGLTGGEPTLYPRFHDLLREIGARDLELYLATNGLLSTETLGRLVEARPLGVSLHLAPEVRAEGRRWTLFRRAAEACVAARINVALRVNLVSPTDDVDELAAVAAELGVNEIRAAVPVPNAGRRNAFVTVASLADYGLLIDRLLMAARRKGVPVVLCKPFPVCALPERSARALLAGGSLAVNCPVHLSDYTNNLVVWPNRAYSPCLGVNTIVERDVTKFASLAQAAFEYRPLIDRLSHVPFLDSCPACPLWTGGRCLGGCLSYRLPNPEA